jgi:hypothetical protein
MNPLEWVRSMFGAKIDLASGKEELTVSTLALIDGIVEGFRHAGVTNVISFLVDKKLIYNDVNNVENDLELILQAAERTGLMGRPFQEMHLALDHHENGIHSIIDLKIRNEVLLGDEELVVDIAGRAEHLRVMEGETAQDYAERVRTFISDINNLNACRLAFEDQVRRFCNSLEKHLTGSKARMEEVQLQLIQPGARQVARFKDLKFGKDAESPTYRPVPTQQRSGAYADPFYYYYYDPYYDFTTYLILDSMLHHHHWNSPYVNVVDSNGTYLYSGDEASHHVAEGWGQDTVSYHDSGVAVSDSVMDQANASNAPDSWGGSDTGSMDSGWGSSDFGSDRGDAGSSCSSSSCGSSCGGSSCGSSCGGGCGGGSD